KKLYRSEIFGYPERYFVLKRRMVLATKSFYKIAGVDVHRAGRCAHAIDGTGFKAVVLILIQQQVVRSHVAGFFQFFQFASNNDPPSWSKCNVAARTPVL